MRMVRGLANADAAKILAGRADRAFVSVDDLWRRSETPVASLVELAKADAFGPALGIARREALWAIKALRDETLPLFAAPSAREQAIVPEVREEPIALKPMTAGRQVVEDYGHVGLTLREHPVSFLRRELAAKEVLTCADAATTRDGRAVRVAGLVLVRQGGDVHHHRG